MIKYKSNNWIDKEENISIKRNITDKAEARHTHEFAEFVYICSGHGKHFINNAEYDVKRGDLLFINYNQTHAFEVDGEIEYVNILLNPEFISKELLNSENVFEIFSIVLFDEFNDDLENIRPIVSFFGHEITEIEEIIEQMVKEFNEKTRGYKSILNGYIRVVFSKMIRCMNSKDSSDAMDYIKSIMPDVMGYIDENCFGKISLNEIAEKCFYNPSYLSRTFKKCYGKSLISYIQERRINESSNLLKTTDFTVDRICSMIGYNDKKQFYKLFKEHTGLTPNEFRKKYQ